MLSNLTRVADGISGQVRRVRWEAEAYLPERGEGQGMIEYGIIIALMSIAAIALLILFKAPLQNLFSNALSALNGGTGCQGQCS